MPSAEIHVIGIDPGVTTGWARLTVPRASLYGGARGAILDWDSGEVFGPEEEQVKLLGRLARETQGLSYQVGPALVVEDFELMTDVLGEDVLSPVRIGAMLRYAAFRNELGDSRVFFQHRGQAKSTATDERLKAWGLYIRGSDHERDAMRHAITALRRASTSEDIRDELWNFVVS